MKILDPLVLPSGVEIPRVQLDNGCIKTGPVPPEHVEEYGQVIWKQGLEAAQFFAELANND